MLMKPASYLVSTEKFGVQISDIAFLKGVAMNNLDLDAFDDLPTREAGPIRRMGYNAKCADGPRYSYTPQLRRFLCSMTGQEWDYAYSFICLKAKAHTRWAEYALEHIERVIDFDCTEEDGRVFDSKGCIVESWGRPEFYTCGGILKRAPQRPKHVHRERFLPQEGLNYYEIDGAFFEVHFRKFFGTTDQYHRLPLRTEYDVLAKTSLTRRECEVRYGGLISWKKRQLSKREIRKLGLGPN